MIPSESADVRGRVKISLNAGRSISFDGIVHLGGFEVVRDNLLTGPILEGLEQAEGCLLCYLWLRDERRFIEHLLMDEVVMNPDFLEEVEAARGFCNRHMHLFYDIAYKSYGADGLAYALYMQAVIERIAGDFQSLCSRFERDIKSTVKFHFPVRGMRRKSPSLYRAFERVVEGERSCPVCSHLLSFDSMRLSTLVEMLGDEDFRRKFESSDGLCLPHFLSAIRLIDERGFENAVDAIQALLKVEMRRIGLVKHLLSEFIRKRSWVFKDEPAGSEVDVNHIVMNLLSGVEGLYYRSNRVPYTLKRDG